MFRIFDRYLLKNFLVPFLYALLGMIAIWLIYDLGENTATFQDAHLRVATIFLFYLTQLPYVLVTWMPLAVLLGLLYVLTRMSRRNEIVSMLGAGVSVTRVLQPLLVLQPMCLPLFVVQPLQFVLHAVRAADDLSRLLCERAGDHVPAGLRL